MGHRLRTIQLDGGLSMQEKACEHYQCRSCGASMVSANFVTGICIQIFVSHHKDCSIFLGNAYEKTKEVTCETCRYHVDGGCSFDGEPDDRIESVRTDCMALTSGGKDGREAER